MPRKKKVQVSKQLAAFLKTEFKSMLKSEKELKEDRKADRRELERKEQKESVRIKRKHGNRGERNPNPFSTVWKAMNAREIALKGKAKLDFNNFIFMCDYFLQIENQGALEDGVLHRKDIHEWISEFLHSKRYIKKNRKPYTNNDIKKIIHRFEHSPERKELHHWWSIFENKLEDFCNPKPRERFKNMTDKEVSDQLLKWNEEAKSEIEKERKSKMPLH
jgi:hypothetical protein